mgnify:CR=1 FL=1
MLHLRVDSNTTLVKVKSLLPFYMLHLRVDSNTTLVKVKFDENARLKEIIKFKYNTC